ncbi:efflux RND transporter periplasmic adaptor subunit [Serpentinicella sp. ANB-PHB4]|uniref:efflux RND transporter periplasmic adaptor subunit n=1 Tax=Serpentinicella sp. ANB-PHB4 TaxID=3074076 RepID=UPI002860FF49|nr:efflux RND transporter periplasmic adaptor subunit [Serpentinicella sp. ANB-PHB4]MDR5658684.1 efflux RND transporter periplasmic adaptor subunit [Serpentinicella sp. ANB-PHB4]
MRRNILILAGLLLLSISFTGCTNVEGDSSAIEEDYVPVEVRSIKKDKIANSADFNGRILANKEAPVLSLTPGMVNKVNVENGDFVEKDSVLFVLDQTEIRKAIDQAKSGVEAAEKAVAQAKDAVNEARENYESSKKEQDNTEKNEEDHEELTLESLREQFQFIEDSASVLNSELAKFQLQQAEMAHQQAKGYLDQAKAGYEQAKAGLDATVVKAPISGLVTNLSVMENQLATNTQPAAIIVDMASVFLQVQVTEGMINQLTRGQEVSVTIPSAKEEVIVGNIDDISYTPDMRTQLYSVKVNISNEENKIKPGMSGRLTLDLDRKEDVLVINRGAVLDKDGEEIVYIVEDNKAVERNVKLGLESDHYIEVIDGLNKNDKVIIKGQHYVGDGEVVKVVRGE